jgi:hypothetical protein
MTLMTLMKFSGESLSSLEKHLGKIRAKRCRPAPSRKNGFRV